MRKIPRRIPTSWMAIALVSSGLLLAACDRKDAGRSTSTSPGVTPQGGKMASDQKAHEGRESMFFPSGREEGSTIRVDKDAPPKIRVGRPYTESITVTNISPKELQNVVLTERISGNFKPSPEEGVELREGSAVWNVGSLKAGESRTFRLSGVAEKPGEIRSCLRVDFQPELCTTRTAEVAALELSMKGPKEPLICEPIEYEFSVRNPGTAALDGVKVQGALPEGLALEEGKSSDLSLDVGTLAAGETKTVKAR